MMPPSPPPEPLEAVPEPLLLLDCDPPPLLDDVVPPPLEDPPDEPEPLDDPPELDPVWPPPSSPWLSLGLVRTSYRHWMRCCTRTRYRWRAGTFQRSE